MQAAGRPRLSWGQRILMAVLGVLIVVVQVMIMQAYRDQSSTILLLDTGQEVLTDLHNTHREAFKLTLTVDRFKLPDGLDEVELRRGLLDRQLEATFGASDEPRLREDLAQIRGQLAGFDAEFARLRAHPTTARLTRARPRLHERTNEVEALLKSTVGQGEVLFLGAIQQALQARASFQRLLIGTSGLTLAVALVLALSLRRRATRAFARAYGRVVAEVNERKLAEQALRQSEQRFRALVHQASDVFTVVGTDGLIRYQSPAVESVLGYPADELIGAGMDALLHPDDHEAFRGLLGKSLARPSASVVDELRMRPHAHPDASRRFEMTVTNLLHDPTVLGLVLNYRDITERALYQEQLTQQAFQDFLTGLPNRARLMERLDFALGQRGSSVGLLFLDLDRFKQVNDTLGHDAGDELLRQVATRLAGCLRNGDVLARLGGDEFIVLLPDATNDDAAMVAQRLEAGLTSRSCSPGKRSRSAPASVWPRARPAGPLPRICCARPIKPCTRRRWPHRAPPRDKPSSGHKRQESNGVEAASQLSSSKSAVDAAQPGRTSTRSASMIRPTGHRSTRTGVYFYLRRERYSEPGPDADETRFPR